MEVVVEFTKFLWGCSFHFTSFYLYCYRISNKDNLYLTDKRVVDSINQPQIEILIDGNSFLVYLNVILN